MQDFVTTPIRDLNLILNKVVRDERGFYCDMAPGGTNNPFFTEGIKHIHASIGTQKLIARGGHYHYRLKENFYTLSGTAIWYFRDFREDSPTFGEEYAVVLGFHKPENKFLEQLPVYTIEEEKMAQIIIPPGVYHIFWPISNEKVIVAGTGSLDYDPEDYVRLTPKEIPEPKDTLRIIRDILENLINSGKSAAEETAPKNISLPPVKALITAGRNVQLRPLTHTMNKHLVPLANKPMIFYGIEHLKDAGIKEIGVVISPEDKELPEIIGDGSRWGVKINYIPQTEGALGLGHVIKTAGNFLGGSPFVLYLGDNIVKTDLKRLLHKFFEQKLNCLLCLNKTKHFQSFGVPEFKDDKIVRIEERPMKPKSEYAIAGLYIYDKSIHAALEHIKPSFRGDYEIQDAHTWLIENKFSVGWEEIDSWWKDRGKPEDILEGNRLALESIQNKIEGMVEPSVNIQGKVEIGKGSKILGHTTLRGPISIGQNTLIKDSYIGPFTSIGNQAEIHNGEIEYCLIMDYTHVNTPTRIVNSLIGKNSIITSTKNLSHSGHKIIIGENSSVSI